MNILIVEDNADDRRLLRCTLEHHGCTVIEARDGEEGFDLATRLRPDIIVSDALMPRMDGFQLLGMLKSDPALRSIPFLFYSAIYTGKREENLALSLGAEAFVVKPMEPEELWEKICAIMQAWEARERTPAHPAMDEGEEQYLREYGRVVATKLEIKVRELEEALLQRRQAEDELTRLNEQLTREVSERIRSEQEQERLQEQLRQSQKMEAVGLLAGGIAHDFNNMLMAIISYGGVLQMKMSEDDPLRPNVDKMLTVVDRAASLTQSLLAFSRKQVMNLRPVNLNDIIRKVEKFLARIIGEDIEIQTTFREDPLAVTVDSGQIEQVLMNLATNARDAMPHGGLLSIATESAEIDGDYIKAHGYGKLGRYAIISISDTGAGMDATTTKRIFEPFFTTKELGKGTGLGLAVVYGIVKQHDGYINVYSEPGIGTTFRISLPLHKDGEHVDTEQEPQPRPTEGTETILLAEDEAELRKLLRDILTEFGYTVIEAVDGEDAIRQFTENRERIQLLLLDLIMPKKSGKDVCDEIRKMGSTVRAIFVSGYPQDAIQRKGFLEEECDLIMKPASPQKLLRKIREVLDR